MKTPEGFTRGEELALREALHEGRVAMCPECAVALDEWPVRPRPDVSYVRDRLWLVCPSCRRSVVLDRRSPE
jgi:hypothetical protein